MMRATSQVARSPLLCPADGSKHPRRNVGRVLCAVSWLVAILDRVDFLRGTGIPRRPQDQAQRPCASLRTQRVSGNGPPRQVKTRATPSPYASFRRGDRKRHHPNGNMRHFHLTPSRALCRRCLVKLLGKRSQARHAVPFPHGPSYAGLSLTGQYLASRKYGPSAVTAGPHRSDVSLFLSRLAP